MGGVETVVDAYEIPERLRQAVICRDGYEVFPWSCKDARTCDLDHTEAFQPGVPGQTRESNLGPLSRRVHRAKTHCGWQLTQLTPGVFEWVTGYGQRFIVGPHGTVRYHEQD